MKITPLIYDYVFKLVFGVRKNIANIEAFLKTVLDLPETEFRGLSISNPFLDRFRKKGKQGILDLKLSTMSWHIINVEVQVAGIKGMIERIVYYLTRLMSEQLSIGEKYAKLRRTISVVICGHTLLTEEFPDYLNRFMLRDEKGRLFTRLLEVCIIELPKVPLEDDGTAVWPFLQCFKCESTEEAEMLARAYPQVKEILGELKRVNLKEELRYLFEYRRKERADRQAREEYQREEGHKAGKIEGHKEGKIEGKIETAKNLKAMGIAIEQIMRATGLTADEIGQL